MSLNVSHCYYLSLTVSLVPWSCYMSIFISHCYWKSLTVFPISMDLLHVSYCLSLLLAVSHCFSQFHGVNVCL